MKTWKRETAWALLAVLISLIALAAFAAMGSTDPFKSILQLIEALMLPVFGFAFAAFGLDWHAKQSKWKQE